MTRLELIRELQACHAQIGLREATAIVDAIFETMTEGLTAGERIELRGFGSFGVRHRPARGGRNPKTGAAITVAATTVAFFRAAKELRAEVNCAAESPPPRSARV